MDVDSSALALYPVDEGVLEEGDMVMFFLVDMGMVSFCLMCDVMIACGVEHEDSPFLVIVIGLSFCRKACLGSRVF